MTFCFPLPLIAWAQWEASNSVKLQSSQAFQDLCLTQSLRWITRPMCSGFLHFSGLSPLSSFPLLLLQPTTVLPVHEIPDLLFSQASVSLVLSACLFFPHMWTTLILSSTLGLCFNTTFSVRPSWPLYLTLEPLYWAPQPPALLYFFLWHFPSSSIECIFITYLYCLSIPARRRAL